MYFSSFLTSFHHQVIKYGVISTESLIEDLMHWKTLYIAGRLHKPVSKMLRLNQCSTVLGKCNEIPQQLTMKGNGEVIIKAINLYGSKSSDRNLLFA